MLAFAATLAASKGRGPARLEMAVVRNRFEPIRQTYVMVLHCRKLCDHERPHPRGASDEDGGAGLRQLALSRAMQATAPWLPRLPPAVRFRPTSGSGFRLKREMLDQHR